MECDGRAEGKACRHEAKGKCDFCHRNFCNEHIRPKLTGSRAHIGSLTDPYWIKRYELDNGDDGHPDPEYTIYERKKHEEEMEEYHKNFNKLFSSLLSPEEEWKILTNTTSCNGSVASSPCDNRPIHVCFACRKAYCGYHANRKHERFPPGHLDGHLCRR